MKISYGFAVSMLFGFLALVGGKARAESIYSLTTALYTFAGKTTKVTYRAKGGASIKEFKTVRAKVETVFKKFSDNGFEPVSEFIVDIYPSKIANAPVGGKDGVFLVSLEARDSEIENLFILFFHLGSGQFTYRSNYGVLRPTMAQILETKKRIEAVLKKYEEEDLPLKLAPKITVSVNTDEPAEIWDGISKGEGLGIGISSKCTEEQIERFFSKYLETSDL
jgi:hypothetical protein